MWLLSTLRSSTQVQQFGVTSATSGCLLFFFSAFIGCSQNNFKGACHHLLCEDAALVKSTKAIWLCTIGYIYLLDYHYLLINDNGNFPLFVCRNKAEEGRKEQRKGEKRAPEMKQMQPVSISKPPSVCVCVCVCVWGW